MPDADSTAFDALQLTRLGRVTAVTAAPGGDWLAVQVTRLDDDDAKYVSDLWRVPTDGGEPVRLTRTDSDDTAPCFRRDGALGFLSNRNPRPAKPEDGDDERRQVWVLPADGAEPRPLTDEPLGVTDFRFARDADVLVTVSPVLPGVPHEDQRERMAERKKHGPSALVYSRMPVRFWDHWLPEEAPHFVAFDADGTGRRDLTPDADREHREADWDLSADGRTIATVTRRQAADRIDDHVLTVIAVETGEHRILAEADRTGFSEPRLSPDGARIAAVRHQRVDGALGKPLLCTVDVDGGDHRPLAEDWDRWPTPAGWTPDGSTIVCTVEDRGRKPLVAVDAGTGDHRMVTSPEIGGVHDAVSVAPDGRIIGTRATLLHPPEPFVCDAQSDAEPRIPARLSGFTPEDGAAIAQVEEITATADDGGEVPSFLLKPAGHGDGDAPLPTLMWIHGGPINQWSDGWQWRWCPLTAVARGYAVCLPNPRGSTGLGQEWVEGIWGNSWGDQCYRDLMATADVLAARDDVDADRMVAMGGSFGGYMTNWIGCNTDRFRCLVNHAGLYGLGAFHGVTDLPAFWAHQMGTTPWDDLDEFERWSPSRKVSDWKSPCLVIHGDKDYRVPVGEALNLFEALKHHGVDAELLIFPDENHWILKPRNIRTWYATVFDFLERRLAD